MEHQQRTMPRKMRDSERKANIYIRVEQPELLQKQTHGLDWTSEKDFFKEGLGRRVFQQDTLVVLLDTTGGKPTVIATGVVMERADLVPDRETYEKDRWTNGKAHLTVGIAFEGGSLANMLPFFDGLGRKGIIPTGTLLFNASAGFFNYNAVLKSLQKRETVPFATELVCGFDQKGFPSMSPDLPHWGMKLDQCDSKLQEAVTADPSQAAAIQLIFNQIIVLVQGPPGTGKSFTGVLMVKAMLDKANQEGRSFYACATQITRWTRFWKNSWTKAYLRLHSFAWGTQLVGIHRLN